MRYKEFCVNENMQSFIRDLIGTGDSSLSSFGTTSSTADPSKNDTDKDQPNSTSVSTGEVLPVKGQISSPFGMRQRGMHNGTDFAVPVGTPVIAPEDGVVWMAGPNGNAGIMVAINSGNTQHKLMHLSQIKVAPGEKVKKGQVVALSGNTGLSTGPHLHWEKHVAGRPIDPMSNIG